jgi:hypothetical protein
MWTVERLSEKDYLSGAAPVLQIAGNVLHNIEK